jgi:hypothetical protein
MAGRLSLELEVSRSGRPPSPRNPALSLIPPPKLHVISCLLRHHPASRLQRRRRFYSTHTASLDIAHLGWHMLARTPTKRDVHPSGTDELNWPPPVRLSLSDSLPYGMVIPSFDEPQTRRFKRLVWRCILLWSFNEVFVDLTCKHLMK